MKKFIFALIAITFSLTISAQRFGTTKNADNTGRTLTYGYLTPTKSATMTIAPNFYNTVISVPSLTISPTFSFVASNAKAGDNIDMIVGASSATRTITLAGAIISSASTFTVGSGKKATYTVIFDGTNFCEKNLTIQP